jgi:exosome complex RNA-binding protein Csl4
VLANYRILDQAKILELQRDLIMRRDNKLKAVQNTVQTEMKSYASVVSKNCSATLAPKKIEAVVRKVSDKDDRSKNVIIHGVEESDLSDSDNEALKKKIENVLEDIGAKPVLKDFCRVGVKISKVKSPRPIKFTLSNSDQVNQVLRGAKQLYIKEGYRSVYICLDRTVEER